MLDSALDPTGVKFTLRSCLPLKVEQESNDVLDHPVQQGWLHKKGGNNHQWQRRWTVFSRGELKYFLNPEEERAQGTISLRDMLSINEASDDSHKQPNAFYVATPGRMYTFAADTPTAQKEWIRALQQSVETFAQHKVITKCGYLDKKGHVNPAFKKRWFVLRDNELLYSNTPTSTTEAIPLADYRAEAGDGMLIELVGANRTYTLRADNARDKEDWLQCVLRIFIHIYTYIYIYKCIYI